MAALFGKKEEKKEVEEATPVVEVTKNLPAQAGEAKVATVHNQVVDGSRLRKR